MSVINTNYLALVSQNNLNKSKDALGAAIERLSSGLRINSAKDDAAGQAIANRFTANIKGLSQAARNANDGISIAQTTEGALNEINNNLQRIRELSVQAANGTNSDSDLKSIQAEISQRLAEIDRVSEQTQFNGVKVLASNQSLSIQVGAHDNQTITVGLKAINASTLGLAGYSIAGDAPVGTVVDATDKDLAILTGDKNVTATSITLNTVTGLDGLDTDSAKVKTVADSNGRVFLEVEVGANPTRAGVATGDKLYLAIGKSDVKVSGTDVEMAVADFSNAKATASTADPLSKLDAALATVDNLRSDLGALQNRFQSTITNLNNTVNNLSAARSRIEDADYAVEVSNMTRAQILQQAGTAVLAQANQVPQTVLSLLR